MNSDQVRAFYEEHKHKIGKDYRLEILKLSKEDVYDYLDNHYQDLIHGWRLALGEATRKLEIKENKHKEEMESLEAQIEKLSNTHVSK